MFFPVGGVLGKCADQYGAVTGASPPLWPDLPSLAFGGSTIALTISAKIVAASTTNARPSGLLRNRTLSIPGLSDAPCPTSAAVPLRMARIFDFVRCRTEPILIRLSSPGQGTKPDIIGHNRAFVASSTVRRGVPWHKARPVLHSVVWIRGRRLLPSSDGMRGLSGGGRKRPPCRCIAFPDAPRDAFSLMRVSWTCGSALPRPCAAQL